MYTYIQVVISGAFINFLLHNHVINIKKKNLFPAKQKARSLYKA